MQQLTRISAKASGLTQALLRPLLVATKNMAKNGRAVRCRASRTTTTTRAAEQSAQQATQTTATTQSTQHRCCTTARATSASALVLLQRAKQIHRAFGLRRVVTQRAQQQRQRGADGALRLRAVGAQLLRDLLQRRALQLRHQLFDKGRGSGGSGHGAIFHKTKSG